MKQYSGHAMQPKPCHVGKISNQAGCESAKFEAAPLFWPLLVIIWPLLIANSVLAADTGDNLFFQPRKFTLEPTNQSELAGSTIWKAEKSDERVWAIPPFFSYHGNPATDSAEFDLLYPLATYDRFGEEYRFQFLQWFSLAGSSDLEEKQRRRLSIFPIYFQQRSPDPAQRYAALAPIYGRLQNRLFRDEIRFVLFPLYVQTRKRDVVTSNYLLPFFHLRHGDGLHGWQFWPWFGLERKEVTARTNSFGEVGTVGGHKKEFIAWPLYFHNRLNLGTDHLETQRVFLPFFSLQRSPHRDSSTYLWPLGFTYTEDRQKKYREWAAPWPFQVFARGEGKTVNRLWPLFSQAKTPTLQSDFYLWPLYKFRRVSSEPFLRERTRIFLFLYSNLTEENTSTGTSFERRDLWPLFTARRDHEGTESLRILSLLEPILPTNKSVERNYSPVWSIWHTEKNAKTGLAKHSLLWSLYRRETTPEAKKYSLFFGLLHYESGPEGKRWSVLRAPAGPRVKL